MHKYTFIYANSLLSLLFVAVGCCSAFAQKFESTFIRFNTQGRVLLTQQGASHFAKLAMSCIHHEYPNKISLVLESDESLQAPHLLYPSFYGCYDWHSSVHGHWMLVKLLGEFPNMPEANDIRNRLDKSFSKDRLLQEAVNFKGSSKSFERMYGWSWLLKLALELENLPGQRANIWKQNLKPLVAEIRKRYIHFLPLQQYPIRTGVHPNTAFGLAFALDYARKVEDTEFAGLIEQSALRYFLQDTDCSARWEPSGEDFLSPCLIEADLIARILPPKKFQKWFKKFMGHRNFSWYAKAVDVSDRSDPKIVHLDGLNLSRAWCMYRIAYSLKKKENKEKTL